MNDRAFSDATKISDASKDAIVSMDGVYKRFKDFEALKNVNFKVGRQEVVVVIGPSGSGKSTHPLTFLQPLYLQNRYYQKEGTNPD